MSPQQRKDSGNTAKAATKPHPKAIIRSIYVDDEGYMHETLQSVGPGCDSEAIVDNNLNVTFNEVLKSNLGSSWDAMAKESFADAMGKFQADPKAFEYNDVPLPEDFNKKRAGSD